MAYLPDRERSAPREREDSGFISGLLLYAVLAAATAYFLWPSLFPPQESYSNPGPYGGGQQAPFNHGRTTGERNHSGVEPFDPFGLRPDGGWQRGGYSPYYPGREGGR